MTNNGASVSYQLTESQLKEVQKIIGPYLAQLQALERQVNAARTTINAIAVAYLTGLGLPSDLSVDLSTGALTSVKEESV